VTGKFKLIGGDLTMSEKSVEELQRMAEVGAEADEVTPAEPGSQPGEYKSGGQDHGGQK
jgi:hypothetical protein